MHSQDELLAIDQFLHRTIPLTAAMGVRVESYSSEGIIITAPLEPNHNHLGTAFGGSLSAIATLAGYSLIWLELGNQEAHVVIRDSVIKFRRPVRGDIRAICRQPAASDLERFRQEYQSMGKARIDLEVVVEDKGLTALQFKGTYVALSSFNHS